MEFKQEALEEAFQGIKANSTDGYGARCWSYAMEWASLMQIEMANGHKLEDVAEKCSRKADYDGITGFMYGAAVSILALVWVHGEELRKWHNINSQIGDEGERANKEGGVLNPAIVGIEKK